jgi:hypothetical protein
MYGLTHPHSCPLPAVTPHDEYYSAAIDASMPAAGGEPDLKALVRILISRRAHLPGINKSFLAKRKQTLLQLCEGAVFGDLKSCLFSLLYGLPSKEE